MAHRVGEVVKLANVSVRTLHHYDEIGLLVPSARSAAGYRLYTAGDLERLQHVLFYREIGIGLEEIRDLMADTAFDRRTALAAQRDLLAKEVYRLEAMLDLIDKTLAAQEEGIPMGQGEMFEVFGDFDPAEHEDEVLERWGKTDAYKESTRRTRRYTKADWTRFKTETDAINGDMAELMDEGVAPSDPRAIDAVERHRVLIDRWFYPCSHKMHAQLGQMYVADPRFAADYEKIRAGMAQYMCDAIAADAARAAREPG
ncbi:MAG: MerR family transcriptional regulator [Actinobacteria bacterium]|nr:MerR family transcriptional regulator [Actinomycetota bacterium]